MDTLLLELETPIDAPAGAATRDGAGVPPTLSTAANLGAAFLDVARARADHAAVATKAGDFSYAWLRRAADGVRRYLCARPGHAAGARVALQLSNSPEYLAAFYGTLLADGVVVPLPVGLERRRRQAIHALCRPDVLISRRDDVNSQEYESATATLRLGGRDDEDLPAPRRQGNDLAMLLFTSGSTGTPKGVMLSHRNLLANAESILRDLPIRAEDRALVIVPFCHALGNSILQTHVLAGATLVLGGALTFPATIVETLRDLEATSFSAVPEVYGMLLKYGRLGEDPLPALRYMAVAGGELRHDLATDIAARIAPAAFHVMYGQSEASARLASLPPAEFHARRGSIGGPIPGVALAIMDEVGRELPPGEVGMLCARGDNVMLGYWQDPVATADVMSPEGWLRTGDLAHHDDAGYFYLDGRASLLVKVQGHRVHPAEIEGVVEAGFPHAHAVAVPMARGDETRFVLFLAPRDHRPIDVAEIRATCQQELPSYKLPLRFEVLDHFPLTSAQKVDRAALSLRLARTPRPVA
jgi:acyl-CoA synthetase (AMP-forming)/AMP-acid ligase II